MGKQGPCCHCGVTTTPLWRNGPPEKPVLCNACGSRWRTKGSLVNYTPLHARLETEEYECKGGSSGRRSIHLGGSKEVKLLKRKQIQESTSVATTSAVRISILDTTIMTGLQKAVDDDTSNRSSSGSAISISESCTHFGGYNDASDLTGSSQPVVWEAAVPSRKRTCVGRPRESSVEKLTKDLCSILHEQSSYFSASSEEDLLLESGTPMLSVETGHGSVLIRQPATSIGREEESEASSLSFTTPPIRICNGIPVIERRDHNIPKREKERFQVLRSRNSPLCSVHIQDVVNFLEFEKHLTVDEQLQLLKYLPSVDTESIRDMFSSREFMDDLLEFQKLLSVGIFEHSKSWSDGEDSRELRQLILTDRTKSKWVECYSLLKRQVNEGMVFRGRDSINFRLSPPHQFSGSVMTVKNEKRLGEGGSSYGMEGAENEGGWFSPKSLFCVPPGGGELMVDAMGVVEDDGCDQDLLLDLPSHTSFPEAELLCPASKPTSFSSLVRLPLR